MSAPVSIEQWPERLNASVKAPFPPHTGGKHGFRRAVSRVIVLRETDSTQDAARRLHAEPGTAIVAWRQTAGRGRLGRSWVDTVEDGAALTIVIERERPERLAIAGAIAAALSAETFTKRPVGIKWPNDICIDQRKVAGVLIEQTESRAFVGIGMNVKQSHWPDELATRAISLLQLGIDADRVQVVESILESFEIALKMSANDLAHEFRKRDVLRGAELEFRIAREVITGRVIDIDPMRGLRITTENGERWLDAACTTIVNESTASMETSALRPLNTKTD